MTHFDNSSKQCVEELEKNGVHIDGKPQLVERLTEIQSWQSGFICLVNNGDRIQISLSGQPTFFDKVLNILTKYGIKQASALVCAKKICGLG